MRRPTRGESAGSAPFPFAADPFVVERGAGVAEPFTARRSSPTGNHGSPSWAVPPGSWSGTMILLPRRACESAGASPPILGLRARFHKGRYDPRCGDGPDCDGGGGHARCFGVRPVDLRAVAGPPQAPRTGLERS